MSITRPATCLIGLGTNLGDRERNLHVAISGLQAIMMIDRVSSVYETPPWGPVEQPDYLNACLAGRTMQEPSELLTSVKAIERAMGRQAGVRYGPRVIDIDLLFYGDRAVRENELTIPHPRLAERAFVLVPLAEICPDFVHPVLGQTIAELCLNVDARGVRRLDIRLTVRPTNDE